MSIHISHQINPEGHDDLRYMMIVTLLSGGNGPGPIRIWSLPGVDGSGEQALVNGVQSKFGLHTNIADWEKLANSILQAKLIMSGSIMAV